MEYEMRKTGEAVLRATDVSEKGVISKNIPKPVPMVFERFDFLLSTMLLVCGFLYCNWVSILYRGAGVTFFAMILLGVTLAYFKNKGIVQCGRSAVWIGLTGIAALEFSLFDDPYIKELNLLFFFGCYLYWVAVNTGKTLDSKLSIYIIGDVVNQAMVIPFSNITCQYFSLTKGLLKNRHSKNFIYALAGFILFLPLMVFVITQLSEADAAFQKLLQEIIAHISISHLLVYGFQFFLGIPVTFYLFGLLYGNATGRHTENLNKEKLGTFAVDIGFAPRLTVYTVLGMFSVVYLIFFLSQATYFLSAFDNKLPGAFTYAEFARRGFFELCKVSAVNVMLLALANIFMDKKGEAAPKMLKVFTAIMAAMTIGLIITALSKMYMYIQSYGLTQLRVYTSWFMLLLLFSFVMIFVRQIKSFSASRVILVGSIVGFLVLTYGNVDGNIAKYNINHYQKGSLEAPDYRMLARLSDGAVPYLYERYQNADDPEERNKIYQAIVYAQSENDRGGYYDNSFKTFNLQTSKANSIRRLLQSEGPPQPKEPEK